MAPYVHSKLVARAADGDQDAWERLDRHHRPRLQRYVRSLARPGTVDVDDVVQETLVRAHAQLRSGRAIGRLDAWLCHVARNLAIDTIRVHQRHRSDVLDGSERAAESGDTETTVLRRERLRRITEDLAGLPDRQRGALLGCVVDGRPVAEVADELALSPGAVRMAIHRGRQNLARAERARDARCEAIRPLLDRAADRGVRPSEDARLHLRECPDCRGYRRALRRVDRRLRALTPPWLPLAGGIGVAGPAAVGVKLTAVVGTVALVTTTGGLVVLATEVRGPGDAAPMTLLGERTYRGDRIVRGVALPRRTALVTAKVELPAGRLAPDAHRSVVLDCPAGTVADGPVVSRTSPLAWRAHYRTYDGHGRRMRLTFDRRSLPQATRMTVGVLCRRPDSNGSLAVRPRRLGPGETPSRTCAVRRGTAERRRLYLFARPGSGWSGQLTSRQPVSIVRADRSRRWSYVISDVGARGWLRSSSLCG